VVARRLAVTPVTVWKWWKVLNKGGPWPLRAIPIPGRPSFVPREKMPALPELLARGALPYGYSTDLWTVLWIVQRVHREWQVSDSKRAMWLILKGHGLSLQRPRRQARERISARSRVGDGARGQVIIRNPTAKGGPRPRRREWVLLHPVRREDLGAGRTGSGAGARGTTAEILHLQPRNTPREALHPRPRGHRSHEEVAEFLRHHLRHIRRRPNMIFRDEDRAHPSDEGRAFLSLHPQLVGHQFPGYPPELNPDEWLLRHLKSREPPSYAPQDVKELRRGLSPAIVRMFVVQDWAPVA
jgi:transposase